MPAAQTTRRFAAIDCGTNSIRLLISERAADGTVTELNRDNIIVRLGQGVDATGGFAPEALQRVDEALGTYAQRMVDYGVEDVMMGATSATRDAKNRDEFFAITARHLGRIVEGRQAEVISGEQEAELSFAGAVADLPAGAPERICVIDLGGGSTEFVVHEVDAEGEIADTGSVQAHSANMGCVRLTERYLHTDPPTAEEIAAAEDFVDGQLREVEAHVDFNGVTRLVVVVAVDDGEHPVAALVRASYPMVEARTEERWLVVHVEEPFVEEGVETVVEGFLAAALSDESGHVVRDAQRIFPRGGLVEEHVPPRCVPGPFEGDRGIDKGGSLHLGVSVGHAVEPTALRVAGQDEALHALVLVIRPPEVLPVTALPQVLLCQFLLA